MHYIYLSETLVHKKPYMHNVIYCVLFHCCFILFSYFPSENVINYRHCVFNQKFTLI